MAEYFSFELALFFPRLLFFINFFLLVISSFIFGEVVETEDMLDLIVSYDFGLNYHVHAPNIR